MTSRVYSYVHPAIHMPVSAFGTHTQPAKSHVEFTPTAFITKYICQNLPGSLPYKYAELSNGWIEYFT